MRLPGEERKLLLRKAALEVAKLIGYRAVTRHNIAAHAHVSSTLIPYHLGDHETLKRGILHDACEQGEVKLIIEGVLEKDRTAIKAAQKYREAIIKLLFGDK